MCRETGSGDPPHVFARSRSSSCWLQLPSVPPTTVWSCQPALSTLQLLQFSRSLPSVEVRPPSPHCLHSAANPQRWGCDALQAAALAIVSGWHQEGPRSSHRSSVHRGFNPVLSPGSVQLQYLSATVPWLAPLRHKRDEPMATLSCTAVVKGRWKGSPSASAHSSSHRPSARPVYTCQLT